MKKLKLILCLGILALGCQDPLPICQYQAAAATNYVIDIITETDTLSQHPDFNFPYTSPFLEDLETDLMAYAGQAAVSVDPSRLISIALESELVFLKVIFSNNLDGSFPIEVDFVEECEE